MADRENIPESVQSFLMEKSRFPPREARRTKEISEGPGPGCRRCSGIPRPAYLPVHTLFCEPQNEKKGWAGCVMSGGMVISGQVRTGFPFRPLLLDGPCGTRSCATRVLTLSRVLPGGKSRSVPPLTGAHSFRIPISWGLSPAFFVPVIVVSCGGVFCIRVQLLS